MHRVTALQKTGAPPSSGLDILRKKIENLAETITVSTTELPQMWRCDILSFKIFSFFFYQCSCRDPYILFINQSKCIIITSLFLRTSHHSWVFAICSLILVFIFVIINHIYLDQYMPSEVIFSLLLLCLLASFLLCFLTPSVSAGLWLWQPGREQHPNPGGNFS